MHSQGTYFYWHRYHGKEFDEYFSQNGSLIYCNNIPGLAVSSGLNFYKNSELTLLIDSFKSSLKGVLLHDGSEYASFFNLKET